MSYISWDQFKYTNSNYTFKKKNDVDSIFFLWATTINRYVLDFRWLHINETHGVLFILNYAFNHLLSLSLSPFPCLFSDSRLVSTKFCTFHSYSCSTNCKTWKTKYKHGNGKCIAHNTKGKRYYTNSNVKMIQITKNKNKER